jgi:hypothetical protein
VQNPEVLINSVEPQKTDNSTSNERGDGLKQTPPSIHQDQPLAPPLPSSLRGHYDPHEGSLPLEHHTHTVDPSDESVQPLETQEPHVDNKVSETFNSNATCYLKSQFRIAH